MAADVSVIVPTRGGSAHLRQALDSALQNPETAELLVVHDRRKAEPLLDPLLPSDPRLRYLESPGPGPSAARNAGIDASRGSYLALLDDDDLWDRDHLARALCTAKRHAGAVLVCCDARLFVDPTPDASAAPPTEPAALPRKSPDLPDGPISLGRLLMGNPIVTPSVVLIARHLRREDRFDPTLRHMEDYDLWLRLARDRFLIFDRYPSVVVRKRPGSSSRDRRGMAESSIEVLRRAKAGLPQGTVGAGALRAREARVWHELAYACLVERDRRGARSALARSILRRPSWIKNYLYLAESLLPGGLRRFGRTG